MDMIGFTSRYGPTLDLVAVLAHDVRLSPQEYAVSIEAYTVTVMVQLAL